MGQISYGNQTASFEIEDRTLAHVEAVVLAKLRRNESFAMTIEAEHGGRDTIWLSASGQLRFTYTSERPPINRAWLDLLIDTANSTSGLRIVPEP
ncbi:MAG TPA: hypothetical protein VGO65_05150 [Pseudolysinimonas sp.]|jgi:hypothetical protein|nr:hypothetical protein [Schumannella sp.]HEV7741785.1 hypothetical protein [Pseudolysinimonas sp.]